MVDFGVEDEKAFVKMFVDVVELLDALGIMVLKRFEVCESVEVFDGEKVLLGFGLANDEKRLLEVVVVVVVVVGAAGCLCTLSVAGCCVSEGFDFLPWTAASS